MNRKKIIWKNNTKTEPQQSVGLLQKNLTPMLSQSPETGKRAELEKVSKEIKNIQKIKLAIDINLQIQETEQI